jgi:AcrR family transcriptional regulator
MTLEPTGSGKRRVIKAPAVRRAELVDTAQALFLAKGYEKTTINDVIAATGLSKGAFYHHFRAKEDLLEAIVARFSQAAAAFVAQVEAERSLDAVRRLNLLLALSREWKTEHLAQLRAMFTTLLRPENAMLYHRIVGAGLAALAPTVSAIIERGAREGAFDVADAGITAEVVLGLAEGRRAVVMDAIALAEGGCAEAAVEAIMRRVRAEEQVIEQLLGLPGGSIDLAGSAEVIRQMMAVWTDG